MANRLMQQDNKQNIDIATIKTDVKWLMKEMEDIKSNHLSSIYKKLECLEKKMNQRIPIWITIILGLLTAVIGWLLK